MTGCHHQDSPIFLSDDDKYCTSLKSLLLGPTLLSSCSRMSTSLTYSKHFVFSALNMVSKHAHLSTMFIEFISNKVTMNLSKYNRRFLYKGNGLIIWRKISNVQFSFQRINPCWQKSSSTTIFTSPIYMGLWATWRLVILLYNFWTLKFTNTVKYVKAKNLDCILTNL
jgi:hypothetical protein